MALVSKNFADIVTFTRASSAMAFNASGVLTSYATNLPRLDYDPVTLAPRGLLIEEQRTNLLLWNRDLTNAAWVKSSVTAAKDQTGIDGVANSASKITASGASGTILQTITSASAARATSAYVKRVTGSGTIEMTQDNGGTWTAITVGASWAKVDLASATVTNPVVGFRIATSGDAIAVDFTGCETGAFSTSPIETTTAQVTRSADVAPLAAISPWMNASEGTVYIEAERISTTGTATTPTVFQIDDGTTNNRINVGASASGVSATAGIVVAGSVAQASFTATSAATNKVALAYKANDFALSINGAAASTDSSGTVPTVTAARLGSNTSAQFNGWIRKITYYPTRKTNAELATLTA